MPLPILLGLIALAFLAGVGLLLQARALQPVARAFVRVALDWRTSVALEKSTGIPRRIETATSIRGRETTLRFESGPPWTGAFLRLLGLGSSFLIRECVQLETLVPGGMEFGIRRAGAVVRFFRRIGVTWGLEFGDPALEEQISIEASEPQRVQALLQSSEARVALASLLASGVDRIKASAGVMIAEIPIARFSRAEREDGLAQFAKKSAPALAAFSLAPVHLGMAAKFTSWKVAKGRASFTPFVIAFSLLVSIGLGGWTVSRRIEPLDIEEVRTGLFAWGAAGGAGLAALFWLFQRSHASGHKFLLAGIVLFAPPASVVGYSGALAMNALLDKSPPVSREVWLRKLQVESGPTGDRCSILVRSWRRGRKSESIAMTRQDFDRVPELPGLPVYVSVKPGFFGFEWVESIVLGDPNGGRLLDVDEPEMRAK